MLFAGILGSDTDKDEPAGVNVNLWVGIALLWAWALWRPLTEELERKDG